MGSRSTCKHVTTLLVGLLDFKLSGNLTVSKSVTEKNCYWKEGKWKRSSSAVKRDHSPVPYNKLQSYGDFEDPRPVHLRGLPNYQSDFTNIVINGYRRSGVDTAFRPGSFLNTF